jgi:hypothetical protein
MSQNPPVPKALGELCPKRVSKGRVSQRCPIIYLKEVPKVLCSQGVPMFIPKPFPNPWFPKHVPNKLLKDVPNNDVQSDTVSRCEPRGLHSNMGQPSRNNDGIACTHRAFNNTARANYYCGGSYTGHKPKVVRWGEAPSLGQWIEGEGLPVHTTRPTGVGSQYTEIVINLR